MLFKIELSPDVKKLRIPPALPQIFPPEKFAESECNMETDTCDGFADDNYTLTSDDPNNLTFLENELNKFESLTGLGCNIKKTSVFLLGNADAIDTKFKIVEKIKILGFTIKKGEPVNITNYAIVWEKISKIMNYWSRFGLSMLGKITIIKTLVLPHINFVGCILEPPGNWLGKVQEKIKKFVMGKDQIAKERIYLPVRSGGIGMIDLRTFLTAQRAGWVKKALASTNDTWKYEINLETNNFSRWDPERINLELNRNIITAGLEIMNAYTRMNNNFLTVPILNNPNFGTSRNRQKKFDTEFFMTNLNYWDYRTVNITWSPLTKDTLTLKSNAKINVQKGHQITPAVYAQLKSGYEIAKKNSRLKEARRQNSKCI
jgi:hypothetical protein